MGRKKTLAGKIRDCLTAVRMWDKCPAEGAEYNKQVFVKAIKGHLDYAAESGEVIPDDLREKAEAVVRKERREALRKMRAECGDMNEFAKKLCEDGSCVSMSQGRRMFHMLGDRS